MLLSTYKQIVAAKLADTKPITTIEAVKDKFGKYTWFEYYTWDIDVKSAEMIKPEDFGIKSKNEQHRRDFLLEMQSNYLYISFLTEYQDDTVNYDICLTRDKNITDIDLHNLVKTGTCDNCLYSANSNDFEMDPFNFNNAFYKTNHNFAKNIVYHLVYKDSDYHKLTKKGELKEINPDA